MSKKTLTSWPPAEILQCGRKFRKRIGLDLHGTVLDFDGPFGKFLGELYPGATMNPDRNVYHVAGDPTSKIGYIEFERALNKFIHLTKGGYGGRASGRRCASRARGTRRRRRRRASLPGRRR